MFRFWGLPDGFCWGAGCLIPWFLLDFADLRCFLWAAVVGLVVGLGFELSGCRISMVAACGF